MGPQVWAHKFGPNNITFEPLLRDFFNGGPTYTKYLPTVLNMFLNPKLMLDFLDAK